MEGTIKRYTIRSRTGSKSSGLEFKQKSLFGDDRKALSALATLVCGVFPFFVSLDDVYGGNKPEQRFVDDSKGLLGSLASLDLGSDERKASFLELTRRVYDEDFTVFLRFHGQKARDDIHVVLNDNGDFFAYFEAEDVDPNVWEECSKLLPEWRLKR